MFYYLFKFLAGNSYHDSATKTTLKPDNPWGLFFIGAAAAVGAVALIVGIVFIARYFWKKSVAKKAAELVEKE